MTDTDITALIKRLRDQAESYDDRAGMLEREAADALEALQDWAAIINHLDEKLVAALLRADRAEAALSSRSAR